MNEQQLAAVEARGEVFVSAGAGTGKTSVLVERFVRAVCDGGLDVDSVLVITYTRKAAAELRARIRAALVERGRPDLARELDGAWISTIHGFCARLLRAHPFAAGIDPRFRELDDEQGAVIRGEAFDRALASFCASGDSERLRLLATYGSSKLRRMLTGVYETLRSAGREPILELGDLADLDALLRELREAAQGLVDDPNATPHHLAAAQAALDLPSLPERLLDLGLLKASGPRAATYDDARKRVEQAALEVLATRDSELLQELLDLFAAEYAAAKERESALDFEDLQLLARDLLRDDERIRETEQLRFRTIMVDEFQDTNALQCELIDLLAGRARRRRSSSSATSSSRSTASAMPTCRSSASGASAAAQRLPLTENYRSRPEVLAAINHLFEPEFGDGYQPLTASGEFPDPVFGHPVELLVTDKALVRGQRRALAPGRGPAHRPPGPRARRHGRRDPRRDRAALRGRHRRRVVRGGAPRARAADLSRDGARLLRPAAGRRPAPYLRLLHNRYDDEALVTVLASPFVGVSNDALVLIRRHAGRRPLFTGIERSLPEALDEEDRRLILAFKQRYERLVAASARLSLERLCEQIVSEHDYDLAVLAHWDGSAATRTCAS